MTQNDPLKVSMRCDQKRTHRHWLWLTLVVGTVVSLTTASACTQTPDPPDLTSLRRSGEATFLCVNSVGEGVSLENCPQGERGDDFELRVGATGFNLVSLVTQTSSAEVAVIRVSGVDASGDPGGGVLDVDPANPGVTPLRVGAQPTGIASTPGGKASFVGVAEPGLEGIYGLPTACIFAPKEGEPNRDRTTWPACSLSSAPGDIVVVVDDMQENGQARRWCAGPPDPELPRAESGGICEVDLSEETAKKGRRKLLVGLPDEGKIVVLDAQELLEREAGTFAPCHIEAELELNGSVPDGLVQPLPNDLVNEATGPSVAYDHLSGVYQSRPMGMELSEGLLVVADAGAPLVHRIDSRDACSLQELSPLVAASYLDPTRVVLTTRVAVSPLLTDGSRFVYAVDAEGEKLASVIIFDISPGSASMMPLVRAGSPLLPREAPDRLEFSSAAKDVAFAILDRPIASPSTGVSVTGTFCDPDPSATGRGIAAEYRPTSDGLGAAAEVYRGIFGYVLLSDGKVALIDVEDYDAPCRRPKTANPASEPDFRGCVSDDIDEKYYTSDGRKDSSPTVTDEASCRVVVPHRARSRVNIETIESGDIFAPSLSSFGRLSLNGRSLPVSRLTPEGRRNPILLGVAFEAPGEGKSTPAQVYVGNQLWTENDTIDPLVIDPNDAENISLVLPSYEPRAYPSREIVRVQYEGNIDRTRTTGKLAPATGENNKAEARFEDEYASFCGLGVQDKSLTSQVGEQEFQLKGGALERFVSRHTDYLQITNLLYNEDDPYWDGAGKECGRDSQFVDDSGYVLCDSAFGKGDADNLADSRDLSVVSAHRDHLQLTPRVKRGRTAEEHLNLVSCCFPRTLSYRVRAGNQWVARGEGTGFEHSVVTDESDTDKSCVFDPTPLRSALRGRAFEVSSTVCEEEDPEKTEACGVGVRKRDDVVCSYDATAGPLKVGAISSECIFSGITRRFVVYRGLAPSQRDMSFDFEVIGGFRGDAVQLVRGTSSSDQSVIPVSMVPLPSFAAMGIVDSENRGLMMVDLVNADRAQQYY